jgi:hypothetical protein
MGSDKKKKKAEEDDRSELEALREELARQKEALEAAVARQIAAETKLQQDQGTEVQTSSRRPRKIVRWDTDTDLQLMLAIQYVCNQEGTKIPWKKVAEALGPEFTEGAIVQHLAKLRNKREEQDKRVPPMLKRSSAIANRGNEGRIKEERTPSPPPSASQRKRRDPSTDMDSDDEFYVLDKRRQQPHYRA